jgi:peptidoglycan/LPS O-acetylase OafA/YrhL
MPPRSASASIKAESASRIAGLDGLRALACLAVFGVHFQQMVQLQGSVGPFDLARFLENGNTGVALFFALSGFLLSIPFWRALERAAPAPAWHSFWFKRAVRIVPAYFVCLTLLVLHNRLWEQPGGGANILLHYLLLFNYSPQYIYAINPPFWTLAVEVQFYVLLPVLFGVIAAFPPRARAALVVGLALLAYLAHYRAIQCASFTAWPWSTQAEVTTNPIFTHSLLAHLPHFLLGVLAGAAYGALKAASSCRYFAVQGGAEGAFWLASAAVLLILATPLDARLVIPFGRYNLPFVPVLLALIVLTAGFTALARGLMEMAPVRWIGQVSYGVYIFHLPVLNFTGRSLRDAGLDVKAQWPLLLAAALALTLAVAAASFYGVERPLLRYARRRA